MGNKSFKFNKTTNPADSAGFVVLLNFFSCFRSPFSLFIGQLFNQAIPEFINGYPPNQ